MQAHAFKSSDLTLKQMCLLRYLLHFIINSREQLCFLNRKASLFMAFYLQTPCCYLHMGGVLLLKRREGRNYVVLLLVNTSSNIHCWVRGLVKKDLAKLSYSLCSSAQLRPCIKRQSHIRMCFAGRKNSFPYRREYGKLKTL